jgi:hypothetical protein
MIFEMAIDRNLNIEQVSRVLPIISGVPVEHILVFSGSFYLQSIPEDIKLVCAIVDRLGDNQFPTRLALKFTNMYSEVINEITFAGQLCEHLGCNALIEDHGEDPYAWILVKGPKNYEKVIVAYDEDDNILLQR